MEVYADILFLVNFIMNFILLNITAEIMSARLKPVRSAVSAAVGAVLGVLCFVPDFKSGEAALLSFGIAFFMTLAAFYPCRTPELLKRTLALYLSSAVACGAMYADMRLFGGGVIKNGVFYVNSPRITAVAAGVWIGARLLSAKLKNRASQKFSSIILEYKGKKVHTEAFSDTGNGLFDPISKKPVMLVEQTILRELVGEECTAENIYEWVESERIRVIPYRNVDTEGYFTGLILDRVYIDGRCVERAIAAICNKNLKCPVILNTGM